MVLIRVLLYIVLNSNRGQVVDGAPSVVGVVDDIPWRTLKRDREAPYYVLDMDKTILETSPGFDQNYWLDSPHQLDLHHKEINQFYDFKP
jgi:hypothetical protein